MLEKNTQPGTDRPTRRDPAQQGSNDDGTTTAGVVQKLSSRPLVWVGLIAAGLLFFVLTTPRSVPSLFLIVGFVVLGGMIFSATRLFLMISGLDRRLPLRQRRSLLLTLTALPVLLLGMQSIGQLTVRDILTMTGLFLIGVFYVNRARH